MDVELRLPSHERGESLLELLIAVAIMGIAVVAVIAGLATSILASDLHRKQSTAGATVRDFGEAIENYVVNTAYTACATTSTYSSTTIGYSPPAGYTASITAVTYWSGTGFVGGACGASTDKGIQQLSLQVTSSDGRATEKLAVVVRKPCRQSDSLCN